MLVGEYQKPRNEENVMAHSHDKVPPRGYRTIDGIVSISRANYALLQMKCSFVFWNKMHGTDSYAQIQVKRRQSNVKGVALPFYFVKN